MGAAVIRLLFRQQFWGKFQSYVTKPLAFLCDLPTPESHTIDDLGIDSLDFLDIVFAIDKEFGIKIPLEQWTQEVNEGKVSTEEYFVLKNLCAKIDELRAAKG